MTETVESARAAYGDSPSGRGSIIAIVLGLLVVAARASGAVQPIDEASPLVGTGGHGHTYPGATAPFGLVQLSPDTRTQGWDACSGYHYSDSSILGFSHTHLSGTGIADLGDVLVLPLTGPIDDSTPLPWRAERFKSGFTHDKELAAPGYYRVTLDKYDVLAELTATPHAAMHRYTFPAAAQSHLLLDLVHGMGNRATQSQLKLESSNLVTGYRRSDGWAKGKTIFFAIECSQPWTGYGLELNDKPLPPDQKEVSGRNLRAHLDFATSAGQKVLLRVGLSPVSVEGAMKNLRAEIPAWDFDAVRKATQDAWNENLSRIRIESSNPNLRQTFYSALYHTMTAPTLYNDADGSYRGPDHEIHSSPGFTYYQTFSLWDTFRAEHPLLTIIEPERVNDFIRTMLAFYQQSPQHALPMWPLTSYETWCMVGYHAMPVICDAYNKGFRDYDAQLALKAMQDTAHSDRYRQDEYQKYGYVPMIKGKVESASRTLDFSYDDWCIAQMAEALGDKSVAAEFTKRSQNYKNAWDAKTGFFRTKLPDGSFPAIFDPKDIGNEEFTEGNGWQYAFSVIQDVPEMIRIYGGQKAFIAKLDEFFNQDSDMPHWRSDVTGIIGQYSHGNEPDHHVAYLYALAGAQYKTARIVRQIMSSQYDNTPEGLCGNDDCGQISSWYAFSALGLYPLNPAGGIYVIGSPLVEKAVIRLDPKFYKGGTFTIIAHDASNQNIYIQSATLNGEPLKRPWITHQEIAKGGTLEFKMGLMPNKTWASVPEPK